MAEPAHRLERCVERSTPRCVVDDVESTTAGQPRDIVRDGLRAIDEVRAKAFNDGPARRRARLGLGRTYQTSRILGGLAVEDNLYLAVLGARGGHLRPTRGGSANAWRAHAREVAGRVGLSERLHMVAGSLSHGEQRQLEIGLALAPSPRLLMLDEPAAGLSGAERLALTSMLLELDPEVTLILIEHDMDVALTVAQRVSMLDQGEMLLEGTPAEIRGSQLVHDLYLGRRHGGH